MQQLNELDLRVLTSRTEVNVNTIKVDVVTGDEAHTTRRTQTEPCGKHTTLHNLAHSSTARLSSQSVTGKRSSVILSTDQP